MATRGGNRGESGNTRIRFIMLEADGNPADLHQIAQAITSAVRPATLIQQIATPSLHPEALPSNGQQQVIPTDPPHYTSVESVDEGIPTSPSNARKAGTKKRRLRTPEVLNDLDLTSGPMPFTTYFNEKGPEDHSKRYLVIAAWLKEYRKINEISIDHIYTCYRMMNMNVTDDVGSIFRSCKKRGWFHTGSQPGWFVINHIGIGQVNSMSKGE